MLSKSGCGEIAVAIPANVKEMPTFVATANAIKYAGASPVFLDVDRDTLGLSPVSLKAWLKQNVEIKNGCAINKFSGARVSACVPMHTFGLPLRIQEISSLCMQYGIHVIEDAAEALGSKIGRGTLAHSDSWLQSVLMEIKSLRQVVVAWY